MLVKYMKKIVLILSILIIIGLVIAYPFIMRKIEINNLEKEVSLVNVYLNGNISYDEVNDFIDDDKTSLIEEKNIDNYVRDIVGNIKKTKDIDDFDLNIDKDTLGDKIKSLDDNRNSILLLKEEFEKIDKNNYIDSLSNQELFNDLITKINILDINNYYDNLLNNINSRYELFKYLNDNKNTWNIIDNKLFFSKRKNYDEFNEKYSDMISSNIIDDKDGPVITASDITVYKGNKLDINSKIKCVDSVDDNVLCNISGNYDTNKVGNYEVKITSEDKSKNISEKKIKVIVKEKTSSKKPYYVEVIRNQNVVIVYGLDENDKYTKVIKVFVCSVGRNNWTPTGTFKTSDKASWGKMAGGVYAQYYTRITGSYLFHSVPYFTKNKGNLEWEEYNKLGSAASLGCVRLAVKDAKWLYDNCPKGTTVKIYDGKLPNGITKPSAIKIDGSSPNKGWDPTDPDKNNPWKK